MPRKPQSATRMEPAGASASRRQAVDALLDAAERLLVEHGHSAITTRRVAKEAGVNHGLVHYYFGSMEELMVQVLERFTEQLIERQRAMYAAPDKTFLEKWRTAWGYQEEDLESGYSKLWMELQAVGWNRPDLRARLAPVNGEWRAVLTEAFSKALRDYGVEDAFPVEAMVSLVMTMAMGFAVERLSDIEEGHAALLRWIDGWLEGLEKQKERREKGAASEE